MNCVSCVVIFFYLLELTLKTQVSNTMNTVQTLCLEIQLITSLTVGLTFLLMPYFYQHSIFSANYHFVFVFANIT